VGEWLGVGVGVGVGVGFWYWLQLVRWEAFMRMSWVCSNEGAVVVVVVVVIDPT
jgi:hypothetical protein